MYEDIEKEEFTYEEEMLHFLLYTEYTGCTV